MNNISNKKSILIKFGGNAMINQDILNNVLDNICYLKSIGFDVILVHGGGPAINQTLDMAEIKSEFIGGHRKTNKEAMTYVEMALKGKVNGEIVRILNSKNQKPIGISGKDAKTVIASKRLHIEENNNLKITIDLGQVGDVKAINPELINILIKNDFIPVIAPIAFGEDNLNYNINADMFAGSLAGAVNSEYYVVLTDVDGLMYNKDDPSTLIKNISVKKAKKEIGNIIVGGMIPKIESCITAIEKGVKNALIVNGTKNDAIKKIMNKEEFLGTIITY
jgi:acetylglutamate kinase